MSFKEKYGFLGEQVAEEFLLAVASYNIQQYSKPEFRVRRHPLLFWRFGWIKSTLLKRIYEILGDDLCIIMSDVSNAALRGTVENGTFITPFTLKRPFAVSTELGQVVTGDQELIQKLLNVLEEGIVNVTLAKISAISQAEIERASNDYGINFVDSNSFTYKTNWVLFGATYNKKFLVDNAFESRFNIISPNQPLDSKLIKHIHNAPPFSVNAEAVELLRREVIRDEPIEAKVKLPDEIYDYDVNPRDCAMLMSNLLCKKWWGLKLSKDEIIDMAKNMKASHDSIWKSAEDRIFDLIVVEPKTVPDIVSSLKDVSLRTVYQALRDLKAIRIDDGGVIKYAIR